MNEVLTARKVCKSIDVPVPEQPIHHRGILLVVQPHRNPLAFAVHQPDVDGSKKATPMAAHCGGELGIGSLRFDGFEGVRNGSTPFGIVGLAGENCKDAAGIVYKGVGGSGGILVCGGGNGR
jgi:hypothetical protein